ncbi:pentapeptide repeat-containing protein [Falsiroseomonas sp. E2-1-a20]|uniref:pentapeptide repeat-containing protein n=1 Tax=Falsiroseomonas sp. E2-1-a20 TaxID=3239300 RepID=UPI003F3D1355
MANLEHLDLLIGSPQRWNDWRDREPHVRIDLAEADLKGQDLEARNLEGANLQKADLRGAVCHKTNFSMADLMSADFRGSILHEAIFSRAQMDGSDFRGAAGISPYFGGARLIAAKFLGNSWTGANFEGADLLQADLTDTNFPDANFSLTSLVRADLTRAKIVGSNLSASNLVYANLTGADISRCRVCGISAWDVSIQGAVQKDLVITPDGAPAITIDELEVAQFIYLILNNNKLRDVINTVTSKAVLILGRFSASRKLVLDTIKEELRKHGYLPVLFDFEKPATRDFTETVQLLAGMARFVIADISDPRSIPQELRATVKDLLSVPFLPILDSAADEYGMFADFLGHSHVLPIYRYTSISQLVSEVQSQIIGPAEAKLVEIRAKL